MSVVGAVYNGVNDSTIGGPTSAIAEVTVQIEHAQQFRSAYRRNNKRGGVKVGPELVKLW
jgi:hypothetical protein